MKLLSWTYLALAYAFVFLPVVVLVVFSFQDGRLPVPPFLGFSLQWYEKVLGDSAPALGRKGGVGRSYADAPEIDGTVRLLPPEKLSRTLKVGEFTRARIVAPEGHDLVALPI